MRKIIFEQVINILLTIFLMIAAYQTVLRVTYNPGPGQYLLQGWGWFLFLTVLILGNLFKNYYAKKLGPKDGYNKDNGEFSSQDEREDLISGKASKVSYSIGAGFLLLICVVSMYINLFITTKVSLTITYIIVAGTGAALTHLTYLFAWIYYDNKD